MTALKVSTITDLQVEVARARQKFPTHESDYQITTALTEEVGELCKELLQLTEKPPRAQDAFGRAEKAYREAIQVACVAVRFAEEARCLSDYQKKRSLLRPEAPGLPVAASLDELPGISPSDPRRRSYGQRSELPTLPGNCVLCGTVPNEANVCGCPLAGFHR